MILKKINNWIIQNNQIKHQSSNIKKEINSNNKIELILILENFFIRK